MSNLQLIDGTKVAGDSITSNSETAIAQRVKVAIGVDGSNDGDASYTLPLPVGAVPATGAMQNGTTQVTPKFASIALSGSGDLVAAVTGKKIRVLSLSGHGTTTGTIKIQSGAATDLTGAVRVLDGTALDAYQSFNPSGHFETASGEKLNAVLTTMTAFDGSLVYVEI